jgi:hypothetical protein
LGCDLFIHGLGGGVYDKVMEAWLARWRPQPWVGLELAPMGVVSADVRLPLGNKDLPTPEHVAHASWRAHHVRHHPPGLEAERARIAERVQLAERNSNERKSLYARLHELIARGRSASAREVEAARREAHRLGEMLEMSKVAYSRTWPAPLHGYPVLEKCAADVARAISENG